jgi:peptide deformylase
VRALDGQGHSRVIKAEGLLAVCIQHEMDHLMGKVFVEYLSPLKRKPHQDQAAESRARSTR